MSLRDIIKSAAREIGCGMQALSVLSAAKDPYRIDTPARHRDGAWVAEQLDRLIGAERSIHWRGLHYALVAAGDVIKPNGAIYRNTEDDWTWLADNAGKAARWLGYVPFDRIVDNRNAETIVFRKERTSPTTMIDTGSIDVDLPEIGAIEPSPLITDVVGRQPYALALFGEKASLEEVALPIAERFQADLILGTGETSDTRVWEIARDAANDGRRLVVITMTDCDPSGYQMTTSIARKLQALRDLQFPELEFEVVAATLTVEQVKELGLPSTPLKDTERRAGKWFEAFGTEQTEIDALASLRPDELRKILVAAIEPYFDTGLDRRVREAEREWRDKAQEIVDEYVDDDDVEALKTRASNAFAQFQEEVDSINDELQEITWAVPDLPEFETPEAEISEAQFSQQAPLISSDWDWADATRALVARKAYEDGD